MESSLGLAAMEKEHKRNRLPDRRACPFGPGRSKDIGKRSADDLGT